MSMAPAFEAVETRFRPITVAMYAEMIRHGIIGEKEPVYLWNGGLATKMGTNRPHTLAVQNTYDGLFLMRIAGYQPESEAPMALRLSPSVPEPDVKLVRGRSADYREGFPTSADVPLVIEVTDTSLAEDRKLAFTYAAEGIPIYWIVNLPGRRLEVYLRARRGGLHAMHAVRTRRGSAGGPRWSRSGPDSREGPLAVRDS